MKGYSANCPHLDKLCCGRLIPGSGTDGTTGSGPAIQVGGQYQGGLAGGNRNCWQVSGTKHQRWRSENVAQVLRETCQGREGLSVGLKTRIAFKLLEEC